MTIHGTPIFITPLATPAAPTSALAGAGAGLLTNGVYKYKVTYIKKQSGVVVRESIPSAADAGTTVADATTDGKINVTIPVSTDPEVTGRRIYRTVHDGSTYKLLTTIDNNTAVLYLDNIADASLGANAGTTSTVVNEIVKTGKQRLQSIIIGKNVTGADVEIGDSLSASTDKTKIKLTSDTLLGAYLSGAEFNYGICITLLLQTQVTLVVAPTN